MHLKNGTWSSREQKNKKWKNKTPGYNSNSAYPHQVMTTSRYKTRIRNSTHLCNAPVIIIIIIIALNLEERIVAHNRYLLLLL